VESAIKASANVVRDYSDLFVNRRAYTLQSSRPRPESGRHYYFRPKARGTGEELSLSAVTIRRHLEGEITIGCTRSIQPRSAPNGLPLTPIMLARWRTCSSCSTPSSKTVWRPPWR